MQWLCSHHAGDMQANGPRVFGLCLVRDEADIIEQSLRHAAAFCSTIFVMDNGSTDDTVAIVERMVAVGLPVVMTVRDTRPYHRGMRRRMFDDHRHLASVDDWWLVLDADEFLLQDPRPFLARAAARNEGLVYTRQLEFAFTRADMQAWRDGRETIRDRERPISARRLWYRSVNFEPRLFRCGAVRAWSLHRNTPWTAGPTSRQVLLNQHFPNRDPDQMARRIAVRRSTSTRAGLLGVTCFGHVVSDAVEDYVLDETFLRKVDPDSVPLYVEDLRPLPFPRSELFQYLKWRLNVLLGRVE